MSKENVINFFKVCTDDTILLEKFEQKNLPEILLHAKSLGYSFSSKELATIIGGMEVHIITQKMGEEINAYSSLWPRMWGKSRLEYIVQELLPNFSEAELKQFFN